MRALVILGASLAAGSVAHAQSPALVIDQLRILSESEVGKDISTKIRDMVVQRTNEFRPAAEALETEKESLDAQIRALKQGQDRLRDELRQRLGSFQRRSADFEQKRQRVQNELDLTRQQSYEKLFDEMQSLLKDITSKNKAHMVLEKNSTLYVVDSIDVTDDVIAALNKSLKTMDVSWVSLPTQQGPPRGAVAAETPPASAPSLGTK